MQAGSGAQIPGGNPSPGASSAGGNDPIGGAGQPVGNPGVIPGDYPLPVDQKVPAPVVPPPSTTPSLADQLAAELAALQALQGTGTPRYAAVPQAAQKSSALVWILLAGTGVGAHFLLRKKKKASD